MKITDYLDALDVTLNVTRYPNQNERWSCSIVGSELKGDGVLIGVFGNADSPRGSICDYITQIQGKILVIGAYTKERQEFKVPNELTC